ncbi:D-arabinono-1,4-lactone oxidase [Streptosporangium sp. KLBMP 9127]|nr:FAD-binding protein [Streptosporangium sp. KLBMP 9127]
MTNWAGNITFQARAVQRPSSVGELQGLVARGTKVRALGSGHSFNTIADSPGELVSLGGLPQEVELDAAAGRVKVTASVRYGELGRRLHEQGYALRNLASLPHISVAGSIATATHGSGDANGNLATAVTGLELVTAGGDLVRIDQGEELRGAVAGLGALGIVTGVTLEVVPTFEMRQNVYEGLPFETLCERFDEIMAAAYSVSVFTGWRGPLVDQVWVKRAPGEEEPDWSWATPAERPRHPVPGMPAGPCTEQFGVPGPWFERLPHFRPEFTPSSGEELQSEYLLPRRHAAGALRALMGISERIAPVLQVSEIRTVAADELWLSPCYREDVMAVHFTWVKDTPAVSRVLALMAERLAPYEARPHWGKLFGDTPEALRAGYERLPDFRALVRRYDPAGKFTNDFLDRHVLGS